MKIKGNAYFLILILAVILLIVILSLTMKAFDSKLLPVLIGSVTFILAAMELVRELKSGKTVTEDKKATAGVAERRGYLISSIWIGGFFLIVYVLGFNIATALFVLTYMKKQGTGWLAAASFAVVTTAIIYGLFELILKVELYRGLLPIWLVP